MSSRSATFVETFAATALSEIGDRSFITATILSLRFPRWIVFCGTFWALTVQSLTSSALGSILHAFAFSQTTLPLTQYLAAVLFAIFAVQHAIEAQRSQWSSRAEVVISRSESYSDSVMTIQTSSGATPLILDVSDDEEDPGVVSTKADEGTNLRAAFGRVFTLVCVAEMGDTSMIVTTTLAANKNPVVVFLGATCANALVNGIGIWAGSATAGYMSGFLPSYRILVTGGSGFIGCHLIERLLNDGHEVLCVDNYASGSRRNIHRFKTNPNFESLRQDITRPFIVECDRIFHLACPASPLHYQTNAIRTLKTNVIGTLNVLGIARRTKARMLITSTSEVYGDPREHPQTEDYFGNVNPCGIRSCYDEGKRAAEALCMDYHRQHGIDIRIARVFNTYGPHMSPEDGRVISNFIVQALTGKSITIYGDGQQTRSFCYISDMVEGLTRLMDSDYVGPVNLGNPVECSVLELARSINSKINPSLNIEFQPLPADDPGRRKPDITRARSLLDWEPVVTLDQGLAETVAYFRRVISPPTVATPKFVSIVEQHIENDVPSLAANDTLKANSTKENMTP